MLFYYDPATGLNTSPEATGRWFAYREGQGYVEVQGPPPPRSAEPVSAPPPPAGTQGDRAAPPLANGTSPDSLYRFDQEHGFVPIEGSASPEPATSVERLIAAYQRLPKAERMRFWLSMDEVEEDFTLSELRWWSQEAYAAQLDMRDPAEWADFVERLGQGREQPYILGGPTR